MKYHFQIRGIPNEQIICFSYENSEIRYVDRIKIKLQKHLVSRKLLIKCQNQNVRNLKRIDNNCNLWHLHFTKLLFRLQLSHQFKWCRSLKDFLHITHVAPVTKLEWLSTNQRNCSNEQNLRSCAIFPNLFFIFSNFIS